MPAHVSTGEEFKAAVALWGRAWQQTPPGSLPNEERLLAAFSGAGPRWKKVREMALRSFVLCADGRYYHRVLCEDVLRASLKKEERRQRTLAASRARRARDGDEPPPPSGGKKLNENSETPHRNDERNDHRNGVRHDERNDDRHDRRDVWRIRVDMTALDYRFDDDGGDPFTMAIRLGSVVRLSASRFLVPYRDLVVIGRVEDCVNNRIQLDLWG